MIVAQRLDLLAQQAELEWNQTKVIKNLHLLLYLTRTDPPKFIIEI